MTTEINVTDIRSLLAAINNPGKLGQILALSETFDKLAQSDERYDGLARALGELWPVLIVKNPVKVHQAVCKVLDECDRLARLQEE